MADETRVWFADAVESLWLKGLGDRLTGSVRAELKELGLDLTPPLKPGYPAEVIGRATQHAARALFPELTPDQATYKMGEIAVDQFAYSLLGRALFPMLKVFGMRRAVQRMQANIRTSNNFSELEIVEVAPERFRIRFAQHDGMPYFFKALVDRGLFHAGAARPSAEALLFDGEGFTMFYDARKTPDAPFPGDDLDRWRVTEPLPR